MSTCPEKDIHSIYLDNELPQTYVPEYETHIASCTQCRAELLKLKQLSALLKDDAGRISFPAEELDGGFVRLQTKLRFSGTLKKLRAPAPSAFRWALPTAAVFAFALIVPISIRQGVSGNQGSQTSVPISIQASALGSGLAMPAVSGFLPGNLIHQVQNTGASSGNYIRSTLPSLTSGTAGSNSYSTDNMFATVDIFRPEFETGNRISVKITLSNLGELPISTEFTVPAWDSAEHLPGNE